MVRFVPLSCNILNHRSVTKVFRSSLSLLEQRKSHLFQISPYQPRPLLIKIPVLSYCSSAFITKRRDNNNNTTGRKGRGTALTTTIRTYQRKSKVMDGDDDHAYGPKVQNQALELELEGMIIPPVSEEEGDDRTYRAILDKLQKQQPACKFRHLGPHPPSLTSEESAATRRQLGWENVTLASGAKAMLIKNGRKKNAGTPANLEEEDRSFVLAVMAANEKLDWKKMKKMLGPKSRSKGARMATADEVWDVTGCVSGAVPPFGSLFVLPSEPGNGGNDVRTVHTFVDRSLQRQGDVINFNCGLRTRSIQMDVSGYFDIEKPELCDFIIDESTS